MRSHLTKQRGFTVIELLVVIAIIAILSSIVVVSLSSDRLKARDTRRVADIKEVEKALNIYALNHNDLPEEQTVNGGCYNNWETSCDFPSSFIDTLRTSGVMDRVPKDPINDNEHFYAYFHYDSNDHLSGGDGCPDSYVILAIKKLEGGQLAQPVQAACPGRDWLDFDYSILLKP